MPTARRTRSPRIRCLLVLLLLAQAAASLPGLEAPVLRMPDWSAIQGAPPAPRLTARASILVDVGTRTVLARNGAELPIPPASLTKVVAIDVALRAALDGRVDLDERFEPPEESWAVNQPPDSSLMFLGPDQLVSFREILAGLAVASGNDAAVALALRVSGSVPAFAAEMNRTMRALGLSEASFVEPSGLSAQNRVTAVGFARFLLAHLALFPESLGLYSMRQMTYPLPENRTSGTGWPPITQRNRNGLLWSYPGVDGVKTGFIEESAYNLAVTAERGGRRLVAIVLGVDGSDHLAGAREREAQAGALLDYGFEWFEVLSFAPPPPQPVRVYGGSLPVVVPEVADLLEVCIPVGMRDRIRGETAQVTAVRSPDLADRQVGTHAVRLDGLLLAEAPIVLRAQEPGSLLRRLWDRIAVFFARLFGGRAVVDPGDLPVAWVRSDR